MYHQHTSAVEVTSPIPAPAPAKQTIESGHPLLTHLAKHVSASVLSPDEIRYIPNMQQDAERWKLAGRLIEFLMDSGNSGLNAVAPASYQASFGNPFIYHMELASRKITDHLEAMIHLQHAQNHSREALNNLSPMMRNYRIRYAQLLKHVEETSAEMSAEAHHLGNHLHHLMEWADKSNLTVHVWGFFATYSTQYFSEAISLEMLSNWFNKITEPDSQHAA